MQTVECDRPCASLASWSRTARPIHDQQSADRLLAHSTRPAVDFDFEPLDETLFGFSTGFLLLASLALGVAALAS